MIAAPATSSGSVLVVAISNLRNKNAIDPLKPRTGEEELCEDRRVLKKRVLLLYRCMPDPKFEEVKTGLM